METLPEITESGVFDISSYGEAVYAAPEEQHQLDRIHAALWPDKTRPDVSEANDALHLATHLKYKRDYFVTTDGRIHKAIAGLERLGIRVLDPRQAADLARAHVLNNPAVDPTTI